MRNAVDYVTDKMMGKGYRKMLWGRFFLGLSGTVGVFLLCIFAGFMLHERHVTAQELVKRAQMHFHAIFIMRQWNAGYDGVYVEKRPGVHSNPHLAHADLTVLNGTVLTKRNPALMTREISDLFNEAGLLRFRVTSLAPINPENQADAFERRALHAFAETGVREVYEESAEEGRTYFRYMAPLLVEESCLSCHGGQGYAPGDVRGGISVRYDITESKQAALERTVLLVALSFAAVLLLLGGMYLMTRRIMGRLWIAQRFIERMAVTDELTGLYNRRYAYSKIVTELALAGRHHAPFSCLMIDIDHFKAVNDTYGHPSGDRVLRDLARIIKGCCRASDVAARFGGEEFLVILPMTDAAGARSAAEKIRTTVQGNTFATAEGQPLRVTVSLGCAAVEFGGVGTVSTEDVIAAADKALYAAKHGGRNRVEGEMFTVASVASATGEARYLGGRDAGVDDGEV